MEALAIVIGVIFFYQFVERAHKIVFFKFLGGLLAVGIVAVAVAQYRYHKDEEASLGAPPATEKRETDHSSVELDAKRLDLKIALLKDDLARASTEEERLSIHRRLLKFSLMKEELEKENGESKPWERYQTQSSPKPSSTQ